MTQQTDSPAERMTRKEAAEYLGVSLSLLAQDATTRRQGVPFYKAGRLVWYLRSELDAWMHAKSVPVAAECDVPSRPLTEQDVKMLAGREVLSARFLHKEFFDFQPTAKPWLRTNHRPLTEQDVKMLAGRETLSARLLNEGEA